MSSEAPLLMPEPGFLLSHVSNLDPLSLISQVASYIEEGAKPHISIETPKCSFC